MADTKEPTEPTDPTEPNEPNEPNGDDGIKDKHGQVGISKEKYEREKKAWEKQVANLQSKIDEAAKEQQVREDLKAEIESLKKEFEDREFDYKLEAAGCKSVKAARALLDDYEGDIEKLKEGAPYLFATKQNGTTGLPPAGAPNDKISRQNKAREAAGLPPLKE